MTYPFDYGTVYNNSINATDLLSNPAHAAIHNALATELYMLKRRPMALYYVGGYMTGTKTAGEALIDAVADMNNNGGGAVVLLPNASHIVTQNLQIGSYGGILGQGYSSVIQLSNNTNLSVVSNNNFSAGNTGLILSNFRIEGNKTNQSSSVYGLDVRKVTKSIFENIWLNNCKSHGASIWYGSTYNMFKNIFTNSNDGSGFLIDGPTLGDATYGNIVDNIVCTSNGIDGVYLGYTYNSPINNIISYGNGRNGFIAAYTNGGIIAGNIISTNNTQDGLVISNSNNIQLNKVYTRSNGAGGFNNIDISDSYKISFMDFNLDASYGQGIYLNNSYSTKFQLGEVTNSTYTGIVIEGGYDNKFIGVNCEGSGQHGVYLDDSNYNIFSACSAKNNSKSAAGSNNGFTFAGTSTRNSLNACTAYDNQASKTQGYGYSYLNTADYNNISGGQYAGNLTGGLNTNTHDVTDGSNITA